MTEINKIINTPNVKVVDVRTPQEFSGGHVAGSVNIPLGEIPNRMSELENNSEPVVLCCASGMRSSQAEAYLKSQGLNNLYNGGSWLDVNYLMNNR